MRAALENDQVSEVNSAGVNLKPGITIDLSRKHIQTLPEEVVDIVKNELERLGFLFIVTDATKTLFTDTKTFAGLLCPTTNLLPCRLGFQNAHISDISTSGLIC